MQEEYNWNLIFMVSVPIAIIEIYVFYTNISNTWKWLALLTGMLLAAGIVYLKDKRKSNIFTAAGIVFLVALIMRFLKQFGVF